MTERGTLVGLLIALVCIGTFTGPARSQTRDAAETVQVMRMLQEPMDTKDFTNPMAFKEAIQLVYELFNARGKELPILVDVRAFMNVNPDVGSPYEAEVKLPPVPRKLPMHATLRTVLAQLPVEATFIVRQGRIEVVPTARATIKSLLQERVLALYEQVPLRDVLDALSAFSGTPIILDARAKDKGQERVTLTLNNLSVEDALQVLTSQAGLRYETLQTGVFVTTPADAKGVEKGQKPRQQ